MRAQRLLPVKQRLTPPPKPESSPADIAVHHRQLPTSKEVARREERCDVTSNATVLTSAALMDSIFQHKRIFSDFTDMDAVCYDHTGSWGQKIEQAGSVPL